MKKNIDSLQLRLSDLFLAIGFLCWAIFLIFGQLFMQFQNPNDVALPLWAAILCFIVMVGSWGYYLYLELYVRKVPFNKIIAIAFIGLALLNVIAIFVQPSESVEIVNVRWDPIHPELVNTQGTALLRVSDTHKFIFIAEIIGVATFIYIAFFVFSKRITNTKFIEYLGFLLFILIGVMIIYSYIAEHASYAAIFNFLLGKDKDLQRYFK